MTDEGYRAPRCQCGHAVAEHKSSRSAGLHASRYGICLVTGCKCTSFVEVQREPTWQCEFCGRFYSRRTATDHGRCIQEYDRRCAEQMWPAG